MSLAQKLFHASLAAGSFGNLNRDSLSSLPDLTLQPSTAHDGIIKSIKKQKSSNNRGANRKKYKKQVIITNISACRHRPVQLGQRVGTVWTVMAAGAVNRDAAYWLRP